jgi:hypothetical protein
MAAAAAAIAAAAAAAVAARAQEDIAIDRIINYCGFRTPAMRRDIRADGFDSFADLLRLTDKDVMALSKGFGERTPTGGKIIFGLRRINLLKATINWARDFQRCSREVSFDPTVIGQQEFLDQIETARLRAEIRKNNAEDSHELSKAADPGKLKKAKDWISWSRGFVNFLATIHGHDGVPLSYVIRENEAPDYSLEQEPGFDFEQLAIASAPLTGLIFTNDARKVHQILRGLVQGELAENWIKPKEKKQNGRIDFITLKDHYDGEGNKDILIQEAETLRDNLTYKNERSMSFEKFLMNMQKMFTGYADNLEPIPKEQKVRLLFQKVQSPALNDLKRTLKVQHSLDKGGNSVTYDFVANQLSALASIQQPDFNNNRQTSGVDSRGSAPSSGIKAQDGSIFTGYYPNWRSLPRGEQTSVIEERKKSGNNNKNKSRKLSAVAKKKKSVQNLKREIASLKVTNNNLRNKREASDDDQEEPQSNAGVRFAGRKAKKEQKLAST